MGMREALAAVAGLVAMALGQPAMSGETEVASSGGWRVVEVWDEDDWLEDPDCAMRHPVAFDAASERLELALRRGRMPRLTVERMVPAEDAPGAAGPEDRYPQVAYGFSKDGESAEEAVATLASLHYRPAAAGEVWMRLEMEVEEAFLDGIAQARWLILWELDEDLQAVGQAAFGIGDPALAVEAARQCLE